MAITATIPAVVSSTESDLSMNCSDIVKAIAYYLGWGRAVPTVADKLASVLAILKIGSRQFYYPPGYEWSFLRREATITSAAGYSLIDLPDDFGSIIGGVVMFEDDNVSPVELRSDEWWARNNLTLFSTGRPQFAVVAPVYHGGRGTNGQRYQLRVVPEADAAYDMILRYRAIPNVIRYASGSYDEVPDGGAMHAETLAESCLASAEISMNDTMSVHRQRFMELLAASIHRDQSASMPDNLGYNEDGSSNFTMNERHKYGVTFTYTGGA
jgi:hypothetical protein